MCTVKLGIRKDIFSKYIEPFIHILPTLYVLVVAVYGLIKDLYVVDPDTGIQCWVYGDDVAIYAWLFGAIPILLPFLCIVVNNILIYCHVRTTLNRTRNSVLGSGRGRSSSSSHHDEMITNVSIQAFLYVGTFMLSYFWVILLGILNVHFNEHYETTNPIIIVFTSIFYFFYPLQGFWNSFVFVRPRYVKYRKYRPQHTRQKAIQWSFFGEEELGQSTSAFTSTSNNLVLDEEEVLIVAPPNKPSSGAGVAKKEEGKEQPCQQLNNNEKFIVDQLEEYSGHFEHLPTEQSLQVAEQQTFREVKS